MYKYLGRLQLISDSSRSYYVVPWDVLSTTAIAVPDINAVFYRIRPLGCKSRHISLSDGLRL